MINQIRLQSVRAHVDSRIKLSGFTALVGPNSTGKSTVLNVLDRLCHTLSHPFTGTGTNTDGGEWFVRSYDPELVVRRGDAGFAAELSVTGPYVGRVRVEAKKRPGSWSWTVSLNGAKPLAINMPTVESQFGFVTEAGVTHQWSAAFSARMFRLEAPKIAQQVPLHSTSSIVQSDGTQTALALLDLLQRRDKSALEAVVRDLRTLVPSLDSVRAVVEAGANASVRLVYDFTDVTDVEASAVSEGTLLATAILIALHGTTGPRVLLLDDIEKGLHPTAQLRFVKQLRRLLEQEPELQIIATTHSPYILDGLEPSQVRAFARRRDGSIAIKSLEEHPEAQRSEGSLTTGQLWALDDEAQWVLPTEERAA